MGDRQQLNAALEERNRILADMDVEAAKAFVSRHGGFISDRPLDWERVLHLARLEVTSMSEGLRAESRVYLARHGAQSFGTLPRTSPYLRAVMDLIFPKSMTEAVIRGMQS